jgi:hypothetical protein
MPFTSCNGFNNSLNNYIDSNLGVATVRNVLPPPDGYIVRGTGDIDIVPGESELIIKLDNPHNLTLITTLNGTLNGADALPGGINYSAFSLRQSAGDTILLGISDVEYGKRFMLTLTLQVSNRPLFYSINKLPDIICVDTLRVSVDENDFLSNPAYSITVDYPITLDTHHVPSANWFMNYKTCILIDSLTFMFQREGRTETIEETYKWDKYNNVLLNVAPDRYDPARPLSLSFPQEFEPVSDPNIIFNNRHIDLESVYHFKVVVRDEMETEREAATAHFDTSLAGPVGVTVTVSTTAFKTLDFTGVPAGNLSPNTQIDLTTSEPLFSHWYINMQGGQCRYQNSSDSVTDVFSFTLPTDMAAGTYTAQVFAYNDPRDVYSGNFMLTVVRP